MLIHINCNCIFVHSFKKDKIWANQHGRKFNLGKWTCRKCGVEINLKPKNYYYKKIF